MRINNTLLSISIRMLQRLRTDRGDVPGWVMITVMTAAVAMVLWGLASSTFQRIFSDAFNAVGPK